MGRWRDELLGIEVVTPESSYVWQYNNADRFTVGTIAESHFDIGQSRSVLWDRRAEAA
ncbi:hypothetical protein [Nocardia vulneris]|uniref:hypothetical protein n=1 Tax=Nocardia vulneris TaxID=1141657 RepID=UPI000A72D096|nr:hypothetical protein [Nocardia vulneris]